MIFECLIQNFPKLTTLPTVQGATSKGASSSNSARTSKSPPVPAPAREAKGRKAPATSQTVPTPAAKGGKATGPKTVPAAAPAPTPIPVPAPAPAPAEPDSTKCCFFNTFKSHWQPNLPLFVCDADPSGLRPCLSGKILNDTYDMR